MILQIGEILTAEECKAIRDSLSENSIWRDGKATAAGAAKQAKSNRQADMSNEIVIGARRKVEQALLANIFFSVAAQPEKFARVMFNRYGDGMSYGKHVDAAYIDGTRCDLSFTLFLNNQSDYEGGELVIDTAGQVHNIKADEGVAILYPSSTLHEVTPVTKGERIACIGWVKSRIQDQEKRSLLFEVESIASGLPEGPHRLRLINVRNNLLRMFGA